MNPQDDPLELQQSLVESSLEIVFSAYDEAVAAGISHPLVVLLDCEDELGGAIARCWLGDEVVEDAVAAQAAADQTPDEAEPTTVFARAIAWDEARGELAAAFPYLEAALAEGPPEDGVFVVGVTAGGASALTAPWDARP